MDKVYEELQFGENEFFRAYQLALKAAGSNQGTITLVEKLRAESDLEESKLYTELQAGIKEVSIQVSQSAGSNPDREQADKIEKNVELLRKKYATKRTAVLEEATIKLRTIALGRF
jgi:hypothetical protein